MSDFCSSPIISFRYKQPQLILYVGRVEMNYCVLISIWNKGPLEYYFVIKSQYSIPLVSYYLSF
jgi:hypothetical protein